MRTIILYLLSVIAVGFIAFMGGKMHERSNTPDLEPVVIVEEVEVPVARNPVKKAPVAEPEKLPGDVSDPAAIVAAASAALANSGVSQDGVFELHRLLGQLSNENIPLALTEIENLPHGSNRQALTAAVVSQWAKSDGSAAMAYTLETLDHANRPAALAGALSAWADTDPTGALSWYQAKMASDEDFDLAIGAKPEYLLPTIFEGLAVKDISSALASFSQLPTVEEKNQALDGIATASLSDEQTQQALELATSALGGDARAARLRIVTQWAKRQPAAAAAWVSEVRDPTEKSQLARSVAQTWIAFEPATAAPWLLENTPQAERPTVVELATSIWVNSDPNAAGEWLGGLPEGKDSDLGRSTFARNIVAVAPDSAFSWAMTIESEQIRYNTMLAVIGQWRYREPEIAVASLKESGLPPEEIENYLKRTVPAQ